MLFYIGKTNAPQRWGGWESTVREATKADSAPKPCQARCKPSSQQTLKAMVCN